MICNLERVYGALQSWLKIDADTFVNILHFNPFSKLEGRQSLVSSFPFSQSCSRPEQECGCLSVGASD